MRYSLTFASVIALLYASVVILRVPSREISWCVQAYVLAECCVHFFGLLGLQKNPAESPWYNAFFTAVTVLTLILAFVVAGRVLISLDVDWAYGVTFAAVVFTAITTARVSKIVIKLWAPEPVQDKTIIVIVKAAISLLCGLVVLLALLEPMAPAIHKAALALSFYWIGSAGFSFAYVIGTSRTFEIWAQWVRRNEIVPAMLIVVFFGWLGFALSGLQRESAPQAVSSDRIQTQEAQ